MPINNKSIFVGKVIIIALLSMSVTNCAWFNKQEEDQQAKNLYFRAKNALQQRSYSDALEKYKQLEISFPFSPYAQNAMIEKSYAHYKNHQYEEAIATLNRFIKLNPNHPNIDYVYYLKGLSHYNYAQGPINWILKRDRTNKDPTTMIDAFSAFKRLHKNYPNSHYNNDAWLRIVVLKNMLAVHEIRIADYYMRRRAYLAVINRCKYVLEHYQGAQHTPEALILLAEAYQHIGSPDLARDTLEVIELNYPGFTQRTRRFGKVSAADKKNWFSNLQDLTGTLFERLRIKPRY